MLSNIFDTPIVEFIYNRCSASSEADITAVVTSNDKSDDELFDYCMAHRIEVYRGDLRNVLYRYVKAAEFYGSDTICRVCADSPFVDVGRIDAMFREFKDSQVDYVFCTPLTFLVGTDAEIVSLNALKESLRASSDDEDLEHVTRYIRNNPERFRTKTIDAGMNLKGFEDMKLTVDYPEDLGFCRSIAASLKDSTNFDSQDIFEIVLMNRSMLDQKKSDHLVLEDR